MCFYSSKSNSKKKNVKHLSQKQFKCDHNGCSKAFYTNMELKSHKEASHADRIFKCSLCEKCYGKKSNLTKHEKKHFEKYACDQAGCTCIFNTKFSLQRHQKSLACPKIAIIRNYQCRTIH